MVIQIILVAILVSALALTVRRSRQGALSRRSAIAWSVIWLAGIVVVLRPEASTAVAAVFGVGRGSDLVLYLAVVALFHAVFRVVLRQERMEKDITKIVTTIALRDSEKRQ